MPVSQLKRERLEKLAADTDRLIADCAGKESGATADDVKKLNEMGSDLLALTQELQVEAKASGSLDAAQTFLQGMSGKSVVPVDNEVDVVNGIVNPKGMTLGEAFTKSPAYHDFISQFRDHSGAISSIPIAKAAQFQADGLYGKALVTGLSDTSGGAFVTTTRLPIVSDLIGERRLTVRDLCTNITIQSDTFDFVTVTSTTNNAAAVLEATTSATPGLNNVAVGAYTAAHGLKPESAMAFAAVSAIVETIAHMIPVTRRAAADGGQIMQLINAFLLYGLREEEEDQILNGSGTTPNLRGILNTAGISTVGSAGTDLDAIVDGIRTIRGNRREPSAMVVHPNDWYSTGFLLAKDTGGNYLVAQPSSSVDQLQALWGLRVVVTPAMTENTVLVGDFRQYVVADRQQATIYVSDSHNDWFQRNLLAILAEERIAGGCLDAEAFCTVTAV